MLLWLGCGECIWREAKWSEGTVRKPEQCPGDRPVAWHTVVAVGTGRSGQTRDMFWRRNQWYLLLSGLVMGRETEERNKNDCEVLMADIECYLLRRGNL